ncbi:hypothetical protein BHE74_00043442 [Ensete ventricosum]|nr:hypothetical protein BHE74_00043442 [Ensete ventricosum]
MQGRPPTARPLAKGGHPQAGDRLRARRQQEGRLRAEAPPAAKGRPVRGCLPMVRPQGQRLPAGSPKRGGTHRGATCGHGAGHRGWLPVGKSSCRLPNGGDGAEGGKRPRAFLREKDYFAPLNLEILRTVLSSRILKMPLTILKILSMS